LGFSAGLAAVVPFRPAGSRTAAGPPILDAPIVAAPVVDAPVVDEAVLGPAVFGPAVVAVACGAGVGATAGVVGAVPGCFPWAGFNAVVGPLPPVATEDVAFCDGTNLACGFDVVGDVGPATGTPFTGTDGVPLTGATLAEGCATAVWPAWGEDPPQAASSADRASKTKTALSLIHR
jgi:hypothetical protein